MKIKRLNLAQASLFFALSLSLSLSPFVSNSEHTQRRKVEFGKVRLVNLNLPQVQLELLLRVLNTTLTHPQKVPWATAGVARSSRSFTGVTLALSNRISLLVNASHSRPLYWRDYYYFIIIIISLSLSLSLFLSLTHSFPTTCCMPCNMQDTKILVF